MAKQTIVKKGAAQKTVAVAKKTAPAAKPAPSGKKAISKPISKPTQVKAPAAPVLTKPEPAAVVAPPVKVATPALPATHKHAPPPKPPVPAGTPLAVSAQSSPGMAANGNTHPANILIVVTCGGWPVTELSRDHFTLMEHFEVPGQTSPFSNNITSFRNAGTGAYLLQTKPINGAPWRSGHHLGQILVSTNEDQQGQAAFKLIVR